VDIGEFFQASGTKTLHRRDISQTDEDPLTKEGTRLKGSSRENELSRLLPDTPR